MSNILYNRTSWTTQYTLSSDHLPIITTQHDYRLQQNRRTFINYKKADWTRFTEDTESAFAQTTIPTNIHTANRIFTNIILMADKHNMPKGKMHSNCRLLPEDIVCKITQRNNIRRAKTCDPALKLLNEEITSDIQKQLYNFTLTTSQVQEAIKQSKNNNSQGPDKLNIRHLKYIGPLGLAFLTSMFKTAINKNIIPQTWKLANIVPIPKLNKDTGKGTSYRPISLLSVIAKTLEKSILPYITAYIANTPMQHGYKTQHSTVTALHTLNNTVAKGFNQMAPPARTITVALDMNKAFDTINIHTLIRKLLQTNIPGTNIHRKLHQGTQSLHNI